MVSIITITYNAEKWIKATMLSVLDQSTTDYEYLIIDGASTDNTLRIARALTADFQGRLRIYSEPDKGLYDAMNKGLRLAKGEYIWYMNAGDQIYSPTTLQHILSHTSPQTDIIYGKASVINQEGKHISEHHKKTPPLLRKNSFLNGLVVSHQAILVRRTIAPSYDTQYRLAADYDWVIKCVINAKNNFYMDQYLCKFLVGGVSNLKRKQAWKERFHIMIHHYGWCPTILAHLWIILKYPFSIKY